jgi:ribosome-binding factor A
LSRRTERLNDLLREEISQVLHHQVRDPRLGGILSITHVDISPDMRYARVFVSILGSDEEKDKAFQGLRRAQGFFRRELAHKLNLRRTPLLSFHLDDSIEEAARVLELMGKVEEGDAP